MKYRDYLPENRPMGIAIELVKKYGFQYRKRSMDCDEFLDVVVSWEKFCFFWQKARCCAIIEPKWREMRIYGDTHKQKMLELAQELEDKLKTVPDCLQNSRLKVEFLSHKLRVV